MALRHKTNGGAFIRGHRGPADTEHLEWHRDNAHQDLQRDTVTDSEAENYKTAQSAYDRHNKERGKVRGED